MKYFKIQCWSIINLTRVITVIFVVWGGVPTYAHMFDHNPEVVPHYILEEDVLVMDLAPMNVEGMTMCIRLLDNDLEELWSKTFSETPDQIRIPEASTKMISGREYEITLSYGLDKVKAFQLCRFAFWPECEQPSSIQWEEWGKDSIMLTWNGSGSAQMEEYQARFYEKSVHYQGKLLDFGIETHFILAKSRLKQIHGLALRKLCKYENGAWIYSNWVNVELPEPYDDLRSLDCTSLEYSYLVSDVTQDGATVTIAGPAPGIYADGPWYTVMYKVIGNDQWETVTWEDSSHVRVIPLQSGTKYDFIVQAAFGNSRFDIGEYCESIVQDTMITTMGNSDFQDVYCGADVDVSFTPGTPDTALQIGEVVLIYGFPLKIKTREHLGGGYYEGTGVIGLPFGTRKVAVSFDSILVNTDLKVEEGIVRVEEDQVVRSRMISLMSQPPPVTFSCVPSTPDPYSFDGETGLNSFGFDTSGVYRVLPPYPGWQEGMPFDSMLDPNGFDANGIHWETGTIYNPNGCSQTGIDSLGNPCNPKGSVPYYWLYPSEGIPTEEGAEFWNNHKNQIDSAIIWSIGQFDQFNDSLVIVYKANCDSIRSDLQTIVSSENLDTAFLFGQNNEYFAEGLHQHFVREPQKYSNFSGRDDMIMSMEKHHFELFHCDKYLHILLNMSGMLDSILLLIETNEDDGLQPFLTFIQGYIIGLDSAQIATQFENPGDLNLFIKGLIFSKLEEDFYHKFGLYVNSELLIQDFKSSSFNLPVGIPSDGIGSNTAHFPSGVGCSLPINASAFDIDDLLNKNIAIAGAALNLKVLEYTSINTSAFMVSGEPELYGQPLELNRDIGSLTYTIFLDSITITPLGAKLDALFMLEVQSGWRIMFSAQDVEFNPGGLDGPGRIMLQSNSPSIPLGKSMQLTILGENDHTYIDWGCSGFEGISVEARIEFCREYLTPLDSTTLEPLDVGNVTASIIGEFDSWSEIIVQLDMDPFAVTGKEGYKFRLDNVWLDFSDIMNPEGIVYPNGYNHPLADDPAWQGVYFEELSVRLPEDMAPKDEGPVTIELHHFVFDDYGASGSIHVGAILPLEKGSCSGWGFSIDTLAIHILENRFGEGRMEGNIHVPLFKSVDNTSDSLKSMDCFRYIANLDSYGRFLFGIEVQSTLRAPALFADVTLHSNTSLNIADAGDGFVVTATLNGTMSIQKEGDDALAIQGIMFDRVVLTNRGQAVRNIGYWSFPLTGVEYSGFELNFRRIGLRESPLEPGAIEAVFLTQMGLTTEGVDLKVDFDFGIQGTLDTATIHHRWTYDKFNFYRINLEGSCTGIDHIQGTLAKYQDDATYGSGFHGAVEVRFSNFEAEVRAMGIFGKKDGFKYGMVDALVIASEGIPLFPPLVMNGFGGGFWYNMNSSGFDEVVLSAAPAQEGISTDLIKSRDVGLSLSGVAYVPMKDHWGLKISMAFATQKSTRALNGNASIVMQIDKKGAMSSLAIIGNLQCMVDINVDASSFNNQSGGDPIHDGLCQNAPVRAYFNLIYSNNENIVEFDAEFAAYLSVGDVIVGNADSAGKLCDVRFHIGNDGWYFWLGEPNKPGGMRVSIIPGVDVSFTTYFNLGTKLPRPAQLDTTLAKFFDVPPSFSLNGAMSNGGGFMHGAKFEVGADTTKVWIFTFYAHLTVGYDLALMQYDALCLHNYEKPGLNGWYASGQLYAYLAAHLGYKFRFFFKTRSGTIAGIQAGVLLRAQLPNPVWAQGVVKARYNILGIIKGSTRFNVEFGTKCQFVNPDSTAYVMDLKVFDYLDPDNGTQNVAPNVKPTVYLQYPAGVPMYFSDGNGDSTEYEIRIERIVVESSGGGERFKWEIDPENRSEIVIEFNEFLRPDHNYMVKAYAYVLVDGEVEDRDTLISGFNVGGMPEIILPENVSESYPHSGQQFFLPGDPDARHCYVDLISGQYYLFSSLPVNGRHIYRLSHGEEVIQEGRIYYDCILSRLNFEIDWSLIDSETEYLIQILTAFELEDEENGPPVFGGYGGGIVEGDPARNLVDPVVGGYPPNYPFPTGFTECRADVIFDDTLKAEKVLFEIPFRTSRYSDWKEKISALEESLVKDSFAIGQSVRYELNGFEGFDDYELFGHNGLAPFFRILLFEDGSEIWHTPYTYFMQNRKPGYFPLTSWDVLPVSYYFPEVENYYLDGIAFATDGIDEVDLSSNENQKYENLVLINQLPWLLQEDLAMLAWAFEATFNEWNINNPGCVELGGPIEDYYLGQPYDELPACLKEYLQGDEIQEMYDMIRLPSNIAVEVNTDTKVRFEYSPKQKTNRSFGSQEIILQYE